MGKDLLGRLRDPSEEEKSFFKRRLEVAGYAADDDWFSQRYKAGVNSSPPTWRDEKKAWKK